MKAYENILGGVSFFNNFIKSLVEPTLIEVGLTDCNFLKKMPFDLSIFWVFPEHIIERLHSHML